MLMRLSFNKIDEIKSQSMLKQIDKLYIKANRNKSIEIFLKLFNYRKTKRNLREQKNNE